MPYIPSIYPEIEDFYQKHPTLHYERTALDRGKFYFDKVTKDRPIERRVDAVYRIFQGEKEYVFYSEQWRGTNHVGNRQEWGWLCGRVDVPYAHYEWDESQSTRVATSVEGHERKYTIEFSDKNMKDIAAHFHVGTKYYVTDGEITYTVGTREQFMTWTYDDLVYYGKTGVKPGTQIVSPGGGSDEAARKQSSEDERKKRS